MAAPYPRMGAPAPPISVPRDPSFINVGQAERVVSGVAGGLLAALGLARGSLGGWLLAGAGGVLAYRGLSGHCPAFAQLGVNTAGGTAEPVEIDQTVTVMQPRDEVYAYWRRLENLPTFMRHVERVEDLGGGRSRWTARGPGVAPDLRWEAETTEDRQGEVIAWRSLPGADVENAGRVRFTDAPSGGTEVHVHIAYRAPAGRAGAALGRWLTPVLGQMVKEDVRRFKRVMEAGETPTIDGQPSGRDKGEG